MVAVLGRAATAAPEAGFQLALAGGPGHAFTALLARETAQRIPAADVPAGDDCGGNAQDDGGHARERNRGNDVLHHAAQNPCGG